MVFEIALQLLIHTVNTDRQTDTSICAHEHKGNVLDSFTEKLCQLMSGCKVFSSFPAVNNYNTSDSNCTPNFLFIS